MTFTCPHTHRQYHATPLETYEINGVVSVAVRCYWCDAAGRFRWQAGFREDNRQIHYQDIAREDVRNV